MLLLYCLGGSGGAGGGAGGQASVNAIAGSPPSYSSLYSPIEYGGNGGAGACTHSSSHRGGEGGKALLCQAFFNP